MVEQQQQVISSLFCIMDMCSSNTFEDESSDNNKRLLVLHDLDVMIGISFDQQFHQVSFRDQKIMLLLRKVYYFI